VYRGKWIVSSSTGQIQWLKTTIVPMSVHKIYFAILIHSSAVVAIWGKCFQQVWNEKFIMFIYTQKFHIFFLFGSVLVFFLTPDFFCAVLGSVSSYAIRMLWMIWKTADEERNKRD
jgi:hypothetical protein